MILKEIKLKTFKCFEDYSVSFEKINLIEGAIGIGKSTILEALIFALYGFSTASLLSDLPTRGKAEKCKVTALIEENGHIIEVCREFPLKLSIKEDGKTLKMSTAEGNAYLIDRFGTRLVFGQFRTLDSYDKDSNFLEQGTTTLKKIMFAGTDELFNKVRNNLNAIKLERERFNRDGIVLDSCYPSEKRLQILNTNLENISSSLVVANQDITQNEKELKNKEIKITSNKGAIESLTRQIERIDSLRSSFDTKLNETENSISLYNTKIENCNKQIENISELRSSYDTELYQQESRHSEVPKVLEDINNQIKNIDTLRSSFDGSLKTAETRLNTLEENIKEFNTQLIEINNQSETVKNTSICYVCKQPLIKETVEDIIKEKQNKKKEITDNIKRYKHDIEIVKTNIETLNKNITNERIQKLEEYKKKIDLLREEDIKICTRIPILKDLIIKEKEETKKNLLKTIEEYKINISKMTEEIEGLKQAIVTEKIETIAKFKKDIEKINAETDILSEELKMEEEILNQDKESRDKITPKKEKIQTLKMRLENRLKQKHLIYTERDVIIVKKAIEELDKLSSVYLVSTVSSLEPIINSVLSKINCQCTFDVDGKGKFEIILIRDEVQYKYKDFSTGQRLLLQTSLKLALLMQQGKSGLVSSDEGLGSLDDETLEFVLNLFKELPFQLIFTRHGYINQDNEVNVIKLGV